MIAPRQVVVGTAGHIDHGKSLLVEALTGTNPDRLKEEKERGITIDIGFANLVLDDGTRVGFVDVPGHERFVKNMLAGVGGIDLVLLCIAADESIKPQTREHFDICRLLRIPRGVIVLTKSDLVEPDILDLVRLEAREFVAGSFLETAPLVAVSGKTGEGLPELKGVLRDLAPDVPARPFRGVMRLPVDRSFTIKGFGSVVTGTLIAGTIHEGDEVAVLPQGTTARVRGLEVFNQPTSTAHPGQRTAVNLQGVEAGAVERGNLLTVPGVLGPSHLLDVELEVLRGASAALRDLARVRFHHGTLEAMARVKLLEGEAIPPGGRAFAQLRLETPVAALPGDRLILRRYSPPVTIGGGTILHNRPSKLRRASSGSRERFARLSDPSPAVRLRAVVDESGASGIDVHGVRSLTGWDPEEAFRFLEPLVRAGEIGLLPAAVVRYVAADAWHDMARQVVASLEEFHRKEPLKEGLAREELRTRLFARLHSDTFKFLLADLAQKGTVRPDKDRLALASHRIALSPKETALMEQIEERFAASGTNPPELDEVIAALEADPGPAQRLFHLLLQRGRLVRIPDGKVFHAGALDDLRRRLWEQRAAKPMIDISEFKELSGTSRKNAIPLLEHFDQTRVTRREGNKRIILPPPADAPRA